MNAPTVPLADWLNDVRRRGLTITVTDGVIHVRGRAANDLDHQQVKHHRHALTVAAAGTHPDWWSVATGKTDPHPDVDLPGTYHDPACATCGQPAPHLDHQLLAWCDQHAEVA